MTMNGFINITKPPGPTSMDVVREIKRLSGLKKGVGHGGTLDPLAEGVLPICFGQATRLMEYLVEGGREYQMVIHLGITTSTYDGEGEVVKRGETAGIDRDDLDKALMSFKGTIYQIPPMYSALKVGGKRLYQLARAGVEVERKPREVEISRVEVVEFDPPTVVLKVVSGRGAYMRSLAHDLGEALGCGGYVGGLVRLRSGPFNLEDAVPMARVQEAHDQGSWQELLKPVDFAVLNMPSVAISDAAERYIRHGHPVRLPPHVGAYASYMERYRAYTQDGRFLSVVRFDKPQNQWQPLKVFNLDLPSPYAPTADNN